jgi:hypothetical protein
MANPAFVQANNAVTGAPGTLAFLSNNTAGSLLVVWVVSQSGAGTITVQDTNNGNVYSVGIPQVNDGSISDVVAFYLPNCKAGANTVQIAATATAFFRVIIAEYSGVALTSPLDAEQLARLVVGATPSSGNITTTGTNDLLVGVGNNGTAPASTAAGSGYTLRVNQGNSAFLEDNNSANNSPGSQSASVTYGSSIVSNIGLMAFLPAPPATHSISGNAGVALATVSWTGTSSGSTTADGSGNYTIPNLADGPYTITPSLAGQVFTPTSRNETVANADITGVDFTASAAPSGGSRGSVVMTTDIFGADIITPKGIIFGTGTRTRITK